MRLIHLGLAAVLTTGVMSQPIHPMLYGSGTEPTKDVFVASAELVILRMDEGTSVLLEGDGVCMGVTPNKGVPVIMGACGGVESYQPFSQRPKMVIVADYPIGIPSDVRVTVECPAGAYVKIVRPE